MDRYLDIIVAVTGRSNRKGLRQAVQRTSFDWLFATAACQQCAEFTANTGKRDPGAIDHQRERYRGAGLLFILAAMLLKDESEVLEALRFLGTRGVEVPDPTYDERRRRAGEARDRSVTYARWYTRGGHERRMQQRLADGIYDLATNPDLLDYALDTYGATACSKHL